MTTKSNNTIEIRTLTDENGNTIIPVTDTQAVFHNGAPLNEVISKIDTNKNEIDSIRALLNSIQTLLLQVNEKLNEHTSE